MVAIPDDVLKSIRFYLVELEKNQIRVLKAFLYGSYAKGTSDKYSDIDIAIISPDFSGFRFEDSCRIIPLRRKIDERIEPMPYLPEDFVDNDPLVVAIKRHGIRIV